MDENETRQRMPVAPQPRLTNVGKTVRKYHACHGSKRKRILHNAYSCFISSAATVAITRAIDLARRVIARKFSFGTISSRGYYLKIGTRRRRDINITGALNYASRTARARSLTFIAIAHSAFRGAGIHGCDVAIARRSFFSCADLPRS